MNFDPACLRLAIAFAGVDHVMAGSDSPYVIGSVEQMPSSIRGLKLTAADESRIMGGNAAGLLGQA